MGFFKFLGVYLYLCPASIHEGANKLFCGQKAGSREEREKEQSLSDSRPRLIGIQIIKSWL